MAQSKRVSLVVVACGAALALLGGFAAGYFAEQGARARAAAEQHAGTRAPRHSEQAADTSKLRYKVPVSMTQPSLGPTDALVTVVEWCDLRGKACRDVDAPMKELLQKYSEDLRWVHRQLPDPARKDAGLTHHFARGMFQHADKFWEVRDRLLRSPDDAALTKDDLRRMADELGVEWAAIDKGIEDRAFARYVGVDILFAGKFGVDAGPVFFVNGRRLAPVAANKLHDALATLIDEELAEARRHLQRGVAKADVYREVTKGGLWAIDDDPAARQAANAKAAADAHKDR